MDPKWRAETALLMASFKRCNSYYEFDKLMNKCIRKKTMPVSPHDASSSMDG